MAQMLIRNLDASVVDALRRRAAALGISTEEQARRALAQSVGLDREAAVARLREVSQRIGPAAGFDSLEALRADRARDGG